MFKYKSIFVISLLLVCTAVNLCVPMVSSSHSVDSWAELKVLSFDGENIFFNVKIFVKGNHADQKMWIRSKPPSSDAVHVEVRRGICDIIFHDGMNITVFSYSYSYDHTQYEAEPKTCGYLAFPWDEHRLVLIIYPSFNLTIDEHPWNCDLPSQNYEGKFKITHAPASDEPFKYKLVLDIKHSSSFVSAVSWMLSATIASTYALSILLTIIIALIALRKKSHDLIPNLIRVSSAIIFFIPAFEIAFYNLKSPLPLVFSDILMILAIPWNIGIIISAVLLNYFKSSKAQKIAR